MSVTVTKPTKKQLAENAKKMKAAIKKLKERLAKAGGKESQNN